MSASGHSLMFVKSLSMLIFRIFCLYIHKFLYIDIIAVWSFGLLLEYLSVEDMRGLSILEDDFIQSAAKQSFFFEILGSTTLTIPMVTYHIKKLRKRTVKE